MFSVLKPHSSRTHLPSTSICSLLSLLLTTSLQVTLVSAKGGRNSSNSGGSRSSYGSSGSDGDFSVFGLSTVLSIVIVLSLVTLCCIALWFLIKYLRSRRRRRAQNVHKTADIESNSFLPAGNITATTTKGDGNGDTSSNTNVNGGIGNGGWGTLQNAIGGMVEKISGPQGYAPLQYPQNKQQQQYLYDQDTRYAGAAGTGAIQCPPQVSYAPPPQYQPTLPLNQPQQQHFATTIQYYPQ